MRKRMKGWLIVATLLMAIRQVAWAAVDQGPELFPQLGHSSSVTSVAFAPAGMETGPAQDHPRGL